MSKMSMRLKARQANVMCLKMTAIYIAKKSPVCFVVIGTGTMGQEHMRGSAIRRARIHGIYDSQALSMDTAEANFRSLQSEPWCDTTIWRRPVMILRRMRC